MSLATDLAVGQPQQFALRSCVLGVGLRAAAGVSDRQISAILYQALLRYIGCNADTHLMAALLGDEYAVRRDFARIDNGRPTEVLGVVIKALLRKSAGASIAATALAVLQGLSRAQGESQQILAGHCEVAERIAACLAMADMVDMRMPHTIGHSRAVADLAEAAARGMGLSAANTVLIRRAALVHDIGELTACADYSIPHAGPVWPCRQPARSWHHDLRPRWVERGRCYRPCDL